MKRVLLLSVILSLSSLLRAETVGLSKFSYLNNNQPAVVIDQSAAQDLLNVDVSPGGKSIKKRNGYGVYKALSTGQALHGGYHFFDSSGNDVQIWGSSTSLYGVVADGTPTQLISSATLNSTWDCTDTQGTAYCVDSSRDALISTNGATKTWYTSPLGTIITSLPDRLVVAGVSGSANTLSFSQSGVFTNFSVGINVTDPFTEVISAPGSKITHIRTACGKLLWWKDQSFGYVQGSDQFSIVPTIISDSIGTFDNTSDVDPGGRVWFRGQDGHIWMYDCSGLQKMSISITPNIQSSGKRVANLWTQTTQSDFQTGSILPSTDLSTTISPSDVVPSSFTVTENSAATGWSSGVTNNTTVGSSGIVLTTNNSGNVNNPDFETTSFANWTTAGSPTQTASQAVSGCTVSPQSGSLFAYFSNGGGGTKISGIKGSIIHSSDSAVLYTNTFSCPASCSGWTLGSLSSSGILGKRVKIKFEVTAPVARSVTTTESYILGGNVGFYYRCDNTDAINNIAPIDNVQNGSSTITSGSFTSQVFDTKLSSGLAQFSAFNYTAATPTPLFSLFTSSSSVGPWSNLTSAASTNKWGQRYYFYSSTITVTSADDAQTSINAVSLVASSTGTFYSAVRNAPSLTAWNSFNVTSQNNGGAHSFFTRSALNPFTVLSSTPSWVAQTNNAQVSASTGTYFQMRDDFTITTATDTPTLSDVTFNWYEGSATDQAYMAYFDNAIWSSVAFGAGQTTNNYIFKYDLINDGWTLYNFGAGGMLVQNNALYFGDTSAGNLFKFGTGTSDNGTAIRSFWKSKNFTGQDPWDQNQYTQLDSYWTRNQNQVSSITYTLDGNASSATSYTISLSSTTKNTISNMKLLPNGKNGQLFNVQVGDTSDASQWEFLGFRMTFTSLPYRPTQ